ncbi:MAG: antitoxin [Spirochaetes bacterium GWF1_49_6]|jgi:uncharacterized protein (DUF433 family)|nr:MAG: antitoxin [Spirochaetes bacterium GWF1_49_6]
MDTESNMKQRVVIDPNICHGKPVIKGTRVLISNLIADLASGLSIDEIIVNYPNVSREDIQAALSFAGELTRFETYPIENLK